MVIYSNKLKIRKDVEYMNIFIGGAWPYANGSLHIGHIAGLLSGDILARYYRLKGKEVLYVSGSDCHGTPISIRAKQEGITPKEIANKYHDEFKYCFDNLGFSYDLYSRTDSEFHKEVVKDVFKKLLNNGYLYKKEVIQTFCESCNQFLPDRYIEGRYNKRRHTMTIDKKVKKYLPLTEATYYILISLVEPLHGYGIMQNVEDISKGEVKLGPGTLYGALSKLEKQGLIIKTDEIDSERRKYYSITEFGKQVVKLEFLRLKKLVEISKDIIKDMGVEINE